MQFVHIILLYLHSQKHLGDNWTFVEELLKITCNPKVSSAFSLKLHNHTIVFIFVNVNHVIRLCVFNNREVLPRSRSGCMPTAVSVSVCCGSPAPVPSPPSGSTTAGIWWVQTFRGNKEINPCIDWRCNDKSCSNMIHYHILCIYTTIRPLLAHISYINYPDHHFLRSVLLLFSHCMFHFCFFAEILRFTLCKRVKSYNISLIF